MNKWALILGASSGFGKAVALELSRNGYHICGVHLDRKSMQPEVDAIKEEITGNGVEVMFFNRNAADESNRNEVLDALKQRCEEEGDGQVMVALHSLAFGTLKPYIAEAPGDAIQAKQMNMTLEVMAHTLVYWTQALHRKGLIGEGSHIFAMTSSGGHEIWANYGAVSAAKAALESHIRQLAFELSKENIAVNAIRAGVTDTPALRKIPGHEQMIEIATDRNPGGRLTTPEDVANAIVSLADPENTWMTGNVIGIDGGEDVAG